MERVNIRIGPVVFDHADYDSENDVLYLHVGEPEAGEGEETPEIPETIETTAEELASALAAG